MKSQKDLVGTLWEDLQSLSCTRVQHLLAYWFNWLNTYEIGVILVVYEDVFIANLQC